VLVPTIYKAYNSKKRVFDVLESKDIQAVIPPKSNSKSSRSFDPVLYEARHLVENFFAKLKQYRAIATRYDKTAAAFLGSVYLAASVVWLA